jgi:hypothetical protein
MIAWLRVVPYPGGVTVVSDLVVYDRDSKLAGDSSNASVSETRDRAPTDGA